MSKEDKNPMRRLQGRGTCVEEPQPSIGTFSPKGGDYIASRTQPIATDGVPKANGPPESKSLLENPGHRIGML